MNKIFAISGALMVTGVAVFFILFNKPGSENKSDSVKNSRGEITASAKTQNENNVNTENFREYSLSGVPEMASGFRFNDNGTFFFFTSMAQATEKLREDIRKMITE